MRSLNPGSSQRGSSNPASAEANKALTLRESYSGGPLSGMGITNVYDQFLRRTNLSSVGLTNRYSYDTASRLLSVAEGTNSATYAYLANSPLVSQISFTNGTAQRMVTTKQYDLLNRLTNIASSANGTTIANFDYKYNSANQRTQRAETDSSYWVYSYDSLGQVISGKRYWSDGSPVAGQQFEYSFDDIGNRTSTRSGGDQYSGAYLRSASYHANDLNQYTSRDVPPYLDVFGSAKTNATVSLWTSDGYWAQTARHDAWYRGELALNNSTGALWLTITNLAALKTSTNDILTNVVGNMFVPKSPEAFTYDLDGNLTSDGRWTNRWDAENRLLSMESLTNDPAASKLRLTFNYDPQSRRITKKVEAWSGSSWSVSYSNRFLYDGWNLVSELSSSNTTARTYTWGLDLSGSGQGAGGIGGLLDINDSTQGREFPAFDGNGNLCALVSATNGNVSAQYEYNPFGQITRSSGSAADANPMRFSTKYNDSETAMLYYGYRSYNPSMGRWLSRDPIEEMGGKNVYGLANNDPQDFADVLGLDIICNCIDAYLQENGILRETYTVSGNNYSALIRVPGAGPSDGAGQILYKMLQSSRKFRVTNLDVNELKRHVQARQNVIAAISAVRWSFGEDNQKFNRNLWVSIPVVRQGVSYSTALNDPFEKPDLYQTGCKNASILVLLKGIMDTIGAAQFDKQLSAGGYPLIWEAARHVGLLRADKVPDGGEQPTLAEWIPGDRGYIRGTGGRGLTAGEWIIYKGGRENHFWGFDDTPHDTTLSGMMDVVRHFAGYAYETGQRWYPGVGLDK